jgi:phosphatidate cytidylyltransferase
VLFGVTTQLRWCAGGEAGDLILGSMIIAVKSGDIGAYTFGRLFGRRKMAPRLSPNKTWAGAFGALFTAALGSIAWQQIATPIFNGNWQPCPWCWAAAYGLVLGLAGMIGDLCESLIKRDMGAKDSAPLLPGLGGVLDFLDSILFAGPIAYLWWQVLPLAKW